MRKPNRVFLIFIALTVIYVSFNLFIPEDANSLTQFDLTAAQAKILKLLVLLPYVAIWFTAFWGFTRLKKYTQLIGRSKHGKGLSKIADGLLVLAVGFPISALGSSISSYFRRYQPHLAAESTIISNYIDAAVGLVALTLIYKGAQFLVTLVKVKRSVFYEYLYLLVFVLISVTFIYLTLTNPARQFPTAEAGRAAYYLPDLLLVTTIIIPYLYTWYAGLNSAYAVQLYRQNVKGQIYKSALGYLASGLLFVILSRIALRYTASLTTLTNSSSLQFLLVGIYLLMVITGTGFVLIAVGTRQLKKIEEA